MEKTSIIEAKLTIVPQSKGPIDWSGVSKELKDRYDRNVAKEEVKNKDEKQV